MAKLKVYNHIMLEGTKVMSNNYIDENQIITFTEDNTQIYVPNTNFTNSANVLAQYGDNYVFKGFYFDEDLTIPVTTGYHNVEDVEISTLVEDEDGYTHSIAIYESWTSENDTRIYRYVYLDGVLLKTAYETDGYNNEGDTAVVESYTGLSTDTFTLTLAGGNTAPSDYYPTLSSEDVVFVGCYADASRTISLNTSGSNTLPQSLITEYPSYYLIKVYEVYTTGTNEEEGGSGDDSGSSSGGTDSGSNGGSTDTGDDNTNTESGGNSGGSSSSGTVPGFTITKEVPVCFKIGTVDYSMYVNELKITSSATYNKQTNAHGDSFVDYINHKRTIDVGIIPLNNTIMALLLNDIDKFSVSLTFLNPQTGKLETDVKCIIPKSNVEYYTIQSNKISFKAFSLSFIEL